MKMKLDLKGKGDGKSRRVKPWQVIIGVVALVLVPSLGNTFAGSIAVNANNGNAVEFGQGITATAACDNDVTITPSAKYDTGTATFYLESVTVSNVKFSGGVAGCLGKTIELSVIDSATNVTNWGSGNKTVSLKVNSSSGDTAPTNLSPASGFTMSTAGGTSDSGTVYFQYTGTITGSIKGPDVTKIIIQSK